jgi:hypothetical protein|tara:strand:- start:3910 stop:4224 length:315 start_codon:yes stop_codon:yes gene_type:complete
MRSTQIYLITGGVTMIDKSFRVIDIASKLQTKNMAWMKEAGSCWPWHITFWDHQSECRPKFLGIKDEFEGDNQIKLRGEVFSYLDVGNLRVNKTGDEGIIHEAT